MIPAREALRRARQHETAIYKLCDTITAGVEQCSNNGKFFTEFCVPEGASKKLLQEMVSALENLGYTVRLLSRERHHDVIVLSWWGE